MANNCYYEMKITGYKEAIGEMIRAMKWEEKYENDGIGRIFDVDIIDDADYQASKDNEVTSVGIVGDCAWSIKSSMIDTGSKRNLINESKRLNLAVEAYSSELGMTFQEHVLIDRGKQLINECVDYEEYYLDELLSNEEYKKEIFEKHNVSSIEELEQLECSNNDGYLKIGGFKDEFGEFRNMTKNVELITNVDFVKEEIANYTENGYYTKYEEKILNEHAYEIARKCDDMCDEWLEENPDKTDIPLDVKLNNLDKAMSKVSKQYQKDYLKDVYMVIVNVNGNDEYNFITSEKGLMEQLGIKPNKEGCDTGYISPSKTYIYERPIDYERLNKFFKGELNDIELMDENSSRYNEDWYCSFELDLCNTNTVEHVRHGAEMFADAEMDLYPAPKLTDKFRDVKTMQSSEPQKDVDQLNKDSKDDKDDPTH